MTFSKLCQKLSKNAQTPVFLTSKLLNMVTLISKFVKKITVWELPNAAFSDQKTHLFGLFAYILNKISKWPEITYNILPVASSSLLYAMAKCNPVAPRYSSPSIISRAHLGKTLSKILASFVWTNVSQIIRIWRRLSPKR